MFENEKEERIDKDKKRILNDINETRFDNSNKYSRINSGNIIKFFKTTGISNKFAGTEVFIFEGYDAINKLMNIKRKIQTQILVMIPIRKKRIL